MTTSPLAGRRIVVTRSRTQASGLSKRLAELGAHVIEVPLIRIADPEDGAAALDAAMAELATYAWVVLTSPNAAERFVRAAGADIGVWSGDDAPQIAVVGPATAAVVEAAGLAVGLMPETHVGDSLVAVFPRGEGRVLFPAADKARPVVEAGLQERGWSVTRVTAYRTMPADINDEQRNAIAEADTITFTSSSTVQFFCQNVGPDAAPETIACIGPITAEQARREGLTPTIVAGEHTVDGLVTALCDHAATHGRSDRP